MHVETPFVRNSANLIHARDAAPTRWKLRDAVKFLSQVLGSLDLEKHPDKTFIGRIERGFDFLGYHFSRKGLMLAKQTIANFIDKASRLYEQERAGPSDASPLEMYVKRWVGFGLLVGLLRVGLLLWGAVEFRYMRRGRDWT
jgi:hypothetical protein